MALSKVVETHYRLELTRDELIELLNDSFLHDQGGRIPKSATCTIKVPTGGDYSGDVLDLDSCGGLVITWETKES